MICVIIITQFAITSSNMIDQVVRLKAILATAVAGCVSATTILAGSNILFLTEA
jgi:hypothetical protein